MEEEWVAVRRGDLELQRGLDHVVRTEGRSWAQLR